METCSFKELEAQPTVLRLREKGAGGVIQVSSAGGNTGRAFCQASALTGGAPVVVVVPGVRRRPALDDRGAPPERLPHHGGRGLLGFHRVRAGGLLHPGDRPPRGRGRRTSPAVTGWGRWCSMGRSLPGGSPPTPTSRRSGAEPGRLPRGKRRSGSSPTPVRHPPPGSPPLPEPPPSSRWSGHGRRDGGISSRPRICRTSKPRSPGSMPTS